MLLNLSPLLGCTGEEQSLFFTQEVLLAVCQEWHLMPISVVLVTEVFSWTRVFSSLNESATFYSCVPVNFYWKVNNHLGCVLICFFV